MASRADYIIEDFGKNIGISNMKFSDERVCTFKIDDKYTVSIVEKKDESLFFYGVLGKVEVSQQEVLFALLLSSNLYLAEANLPTLGLEPETGMLVMAKVYPLDGLDAMVIESVIDKLANQIEHIGSTIREDFNIELVN